MKVIFNKLIPFRGFAAINLFGLIFVRKELETWYCQRPERFSKMINHEEIHTAQQKELLFVFFYLIYFFEWIIRLFINGRKAYDNISFEREAYNHENDFNYLKNRKLFAMWRK